MVTSGIERMTQAIVYILICINVLTFLVYGIDKWKAKQGSWRISEATLLTLAVVGGSIGALLGMQVWHHKTMHKKFKYGLPLILLVQIALLSLCSCATTASHTPSYSTEIPVMENKSVQEHSPNVFLVMYDAEIGKAPLQKAIKEYQCEIVYDYGIINGMALKKPENKTLEETIQYFKSVKGVISVEYDHIIRLTDPVKSRLEIQ